MICCAQAFTNFLRTVTWYVTPDRMMDLTTWSSSPSSFHWYDVCGRKVTRPDARNFLMTCEKESEVRRENDSEEEETHLVVVRQHLVLGGQIDLPRIPFQNLAVHAVKVRPLVQRDEGVGVVPVPAGPRELVGDHEGGCLAARQNLVDESLREGERGQKRESTARRRRLTIPAAPAPITK